MAILDSINDSMVREEYPSTNYGGSSDMYVQVVPNKESRSYVKFDLSGFTVATNKATLRLYVDNAACGISATLLTFRRVTSSWDESTLLWTNKPTATSTNEVQKTIAVSWAGWIEVDVTNIINDMISGTNYGIEITGDNTNCTCVISTKESSSDPLLKINEYYVKTGGNDASDGRSWANAWATINKAATTVPDGSTVYLEHGTYNAEPAANKIAPQNAGAAGIDYRPEIVGGGAGAATVTVDKN